MGHIKRVTVEFHPGSKPIGGRILAPGAAPQSFAGYVGLIAALEQLRQHEQHPLPVDHHNTATTAPAEGRQTP